MTSTQTPPRSPEAGPAEPRNGHEVAEFRGLHWSTVLLLVVALLVGLGLGHTVFAGDPHREAAAEHRAAVLASRLQEARRTVATLESRLAALSARSEGTEELAALAAGLLPGTRPQGARVHPAVGRVVRLVDGVGSRPASRFAEAAVLTDVVGGRAVQGAASIGRYLAGPPGHVLTRTGRVLQFRDYALARVVVFTPYDEVIAHVRLRGVRTAAVLVVSLDGDRIGHAWLI